METKSNDVGLPGSKLMITDGQTMVSDVDLQAVEARSQINTGMEEQKRRA